MAARKTYTDQELLEYSGEHLFYEFQMFDGVSEAIPRHKNDIERNAFLESFVIHLRNLIDFFYPPSEDAQIKSDDIFAGDFFDAPDIRYLGAIPLLLKDARERANKEISHITYKRKAAEDPTKPWSVSDLFKEVHAISKEFAAKASSNKLDPKVTSLLKDGPKTGAVLVMVNASTSVPKTTVVGGFSAGIKP